MTHPFHAIAELATDWEGLRLIEEREGRYVRLFFRPLDLLFIRKADPGDSIDRVSFGFARRVEFSDDQLAKGPQAMLTQLKDAARIEAARRADVLARKTKKTGSKA